MDTTVNQAQFEREVRDPEGCRRHADYLVDGCLKHMRETDPMGGDVTAQRKDIAAFITITRLQQFTSMFAGWAINHQIGLALEGRGFVPLQPSGTREHPQYLEARAEVDSHRHEIAGANFDRSGYLSGQVPRDPAFERQLLVNMLRALSTGDYLVDSVLRRCAEAFNALEYGETDPLFEPRQTGWTRPAYRLCRAHLRALAHVQYAVALNGGHDRVKTMNQIAKKFGISLSGLKAWERDLRSKLGSLEVDRELSFARNHGRSARAARNLPPSMEARQKFLRHDAEYGETAVERSVEICRRVARGENTV